MRSLIRAAALVVASVPVLVAAKPARAQSVAGVWEASIPTQVRNEGGTETAADPVTVTIKLEQQGDSVFGTLQRAKIEGRPDAPLRKIAGSLKNGVLTLISEPSEGKLMRGGEGQIIKLVPVYTLKLEGDSLTGTQRVDAEGMDIQPQERPFTAKRVKA
jgi:hypothetical protein